MILNRTYSLVQGHECLSASIGNYLNYFCPDITGNEVLIAGNGFNVIYDKKQKIIGAPIYEANFSFMEKYGVSYVRGNCYEERKGFLYHCIKQKEKIILRVDAQQLTYNRVFQQATNSPHYIDLMGVDGERFYICDGYVPTRETSIFEGWINYDCLIKAWEAMKYEYLILNWDKTLDTLQILRDVDEILCQNLTEYITGGNKGVNFYGQDAILKLFADLNAVFWGDNAKEQILQYNYQLKIFGFLALKETLKEILNKKTGFDELALKYNDVITQWNRICMLLVKIAFSAKISNLENLNRKVIDCVLKEKDIIIQVINKLGR